MRLFIRVRVRVRVRARVRVRVRVRVSMDDLKLDINEDYSNPDSNYNP